MNNFFNSNTNKNDNQQLVPTSTNQNMPNNPLKRNLKLEFQPGMDNSNSQGNKNAKKPRLRLPNHPMLNLNIPVLSSPDLNKLNFTTPEIEKFIMQNVSSNQTPTPTQVLFSTNIMEEQELMAKSFQDTYNELKNNTSDSSIQSKLLKSENSNDTFDMTRCSSNSSSATYTTLDSSNQFPMHEEFPDTTNLVNSALPNMSCYIDMNSSDGSMLIKDEPAHSIASTSPPMSPIDMESQERIKIERKRQRNRVAASKCRKRKLERIANLEERVKILKGENNELASVASKLKQQVCSLKEQVMEHVHNGCQINVVMSQLSQF